MKAILLVAGAGRRLRPLTDTVPKCMVPIAGKPVLQHTIEWCRSLGIEEFVLNPCYLPQVITAHFGDGRQLGVRIHYSVEESPLGTAGGVRRAVRFLGDHEPFLVWYGDNLSLCDVRRLRELHLVRGGIATIALNQQQDVRQSGIVGIDDDDRISRFLEKPMPDQVFSHWVNAGIYMMEPGVIEAIPDAVPSDFGHDVLPALLAGGAALYGYRLSDKEGLWTLDRLEDLVCTRAHPQWTLTETTPGL
jgi:NDP-sugar pyrophosphorylase family protein